MRSFQRGFREEDAIVGDDANRIAVYMAEAADQRRPVKRFEFVEFTLVQYPGQELA